MSVEILIPRFQTWECVFSFKIKIKYSVLDFLFGEDYPLLVTSKLWLKAKKQIKASHV